MNKSQTKSNQITVSLDNESPPAVKSVEPAARKHLAVETDPLKIYADITLNFGKYKGKSLGELSDDLPNGYNYLVWLHKALKATQEEQEISPTKLAIIKFVEALKKL